MSRQGTKAAGHTIHTRQLPDPLRHPSRCKSGAVLRAGGRRIKAGRFGASGRNKPDRQPRNVEGQHLPGEEAGVRRLQSDKRRDEHARTGEQHEREGDLRRGEHTQAAIGARRDPARLRQGYGGSAEAPKGRRRKLDPSMRAAAGHRRAARQQRWRGRADPEDGIVNGDIERAHREAGRIRATTDTSGRASTTPRMAPAPHSTRLSASSVRRSAPRLAPSAARTASSPSRRTERARIRFATFEHAMTNTTPAAASKQEQDRTRRRGDLFAKRRDGQVHVGSCRVRLRVLAHHGGVRRRQLSARGLDGHTWREPAEEVGHSMLALDVHRRAEVMRARHHVGDDLGVDRVRHDGSRTPTMVAVRGPRRTSCQSRGDRVEQAGPESMRQHDRAAAPGPSSVAFSSRPSTGRSPMTSK